MCPRWLSQSAPLESPIEKAAAPQTAECGGNRGLLLAGAADRPRPGRARPAPRPGRASWRCRRADWRSGGRTRYGRADRSRACSGKTVMSRSFRRRFAVDVQVTMRAILIDPSRCPSSDRTASSSWRRVPGDLLERARGSPRSTDGRYPRRWSSTRRADAHSVSFVGVRGCRDSSSSCSSSWPPSSSARRFRLAATPPAAGSAAR